MYIIIKIIQKITQVKILYKLSLKAKSPNAMPSFQIKCMSKNFDVNISIPIFFLSK